MAEKSYIRCAEINQNYYGEVNVGAELNSSAFSVTGDFSPNLLSIHDAIQKFETATNLERHQQTPSP